MSRVIKASALKRLKGTYRSNSGVVLPHIERHVMRNPLIDIRPDDHSLKYMHPSDMAKADWCGRHDYYRMTGALIEKVPNRNPSFRMENILAEGHTIHDKYQRWLWEMGVLWGMWKCRDCGHTWGALSPDFCQFCHSDRLRYAEVPMRRERYMVEGHSDGAVHKLGGFTGLVEVKSIGIRTLAFEAPRLYNRYMDGEKAEDIWFEIQRPFATHMRQGQLYLWMSWPAYEQMVFIYESKFHQQTKEFVVSYNKRYIAPVLEIAREVSQCVRAGFPPDRPEWAEDPEGKICASCEYRRTCWEGRVESESAPEVPVQTVQVRRAKTATRRKALGRSLPSKGV